MKMERDQSKENMCREKERKIKGIFMEGGRERKKRRIREIIKFIEERDERWKDKKTDRQKEKFIKTLSRAENCLSRAQPPSPPLSLYLSFLFLSLAAPLLSKDYGCTK